MKKEDLTPGKIYKSDVNSDSDSIFLVRITEDYLKCTAFVISRHGKIVTEGALYNSNYYNFNNNNYIYSLPSDEERMWFEYCESVGEFYPLEEALDFMYARQFVQEYLTLN